MEIPLIVFLIFSVAVGLKSHDDDVKKINELKHQVAKRNTKPVKRVKMVKVVKNQSIKVVNLGT